jgi:hypothetical protein
MQELPELGLRQPGQLPRFADFGRGHLFLMIGTYIGENIVILLQHFLQVRDVLFVHVDKRKIMLAVIALDRISPRAVAGKGEPVYRKRSLIIGEDDFVASGCSHFISPLDVAWSIGCCTIRTIQKLCSGYTRRERGIFFRIGGKRKILALIAILALSGCA